MNISFPSKKKRNSSDDEGSSADEFDSPRSDVVRQEVKKLRRVVRRGEKVFRHMSESFEPEKITEKEISITEEIFSRALASQAPAPPMSPVRQPSTFACFACGERIPLNSVRCPSCDVLYVSDPNGEARDESIAEESETVLESGDTGVFKMGTMAFVHLDLTTGVATCLKSDGEEDECGLECGNCGSVILFGTDRCPLCGHFLEEDDMGLVSLLTGLKFDLDSERELDCPSCGQHVVVEGGTCPACHELIALRNDRALDAAVTPILRDKDIVFVHLDVWNDDLWFARRVKLKRKKMDEPIRLDRISKTGSDFDWKSISRI